MERLKQQPGISDLIRMIETWPRITAWVILSLGCVILLAIEAHDVGLSAGNWIALIVATVAVAGLCILIVSWEDEEDADGANSAGVKSALSGQAKAEPESAGDDTTTDPAD